MENKEKDSDSQHMAMLKLEYSILVDLIKHQHTRVQDFDRTFLTANTILIAACAILLGRDKTELYSYLIPLCILGIAISFVWLSVLQRMKVDSDLRWFQLRDIERLLSRPRGVFSGGYTFFRDKELETSDGKEVPLKFPGGLLGALARFRVVWAGIILPLLFALLYAVLMFIGGKC